MKILFFLIVSVLLPGLQDVTAQSCGNRVIDPDIAAFLKLIGNMDLTLEQLRAIPIEQIKYMDAPHVPYPTEDVQRMKITADSIPVLVFNATHGSNLPIMINYHGGGFISPLLKGLEHSLWKDSKTYGAIVFAIDYRVAPEHRFPAAVNDSYNAFKWVADHGNLFGGDTGRVVLYGNSAGANLVAVVTQKAKVEGISSKIKLQVMNGLPVDLRPTNIETSRSYSENARGYMQTKAACIFAVETYAPGQYNNPEVSPIISDNLKGLPPAVIITAEFDPLRDDGILYAAKLRSYGVKVWEKCFPGQIHCLIGAPPGSPAVREYDDLVSKAMLESFRK